MSISRSTNAVCFTYRPEATFAPSVRPFIAIGRCACVTPRPDAFPIWTFQHAGDDGCLSLSVALTARPWHSSPSQHRPLSQSSNEVLYSGTSPLPIQILSKSISRHWIRYGECPRFILRWNFEAHPWRSLVRVYALAVDLPWSNGHKCPDTVRHSNDAQTLFTQRPYELRKVKDIWFVTRHNINNWLKNMFG